MPLSDGDKINEKNKTPLLYLRNGVSMIQSIASSLKGAQKLIF